MARTVTVDWREFFTEDKPENRRIHPVVKTAGIAHIAFIPTSVFASAAPGDATWTEIFTTVLNIADWLCVGVIVFSGVTWMFGNRTKAIEFVMGGSIGYVIIRHAVDIRNWLKAL